MKISSFDLNLFVIMNSIYTEGSLTKAAEVVGITQPAVSNALSRLREKFNDDLFVRTGSGMVPTQKTENIIDISYSIDNEKKLSYVDNVNYSPPANKSIAQFIYEIIEKDIQNTN